MLGTRILVILFVSVFTQLNNEFAKGLSSFGATNFSGQSDNIYRFYGISGQFVTFQTWLESSNEESAFAKTDSTLSFEFRTKKPSQFLMYLDDQDQSFLALILADGSVKLRFKFGNSASSFLRTGFSLNNNEWHTVQLRYRSSSLTLTVDGFPVTAWFDLTQRFGFVQLSDTYFAGLPRALKYHSLALPSIQFVNGFVGRMRSFVINGEPAVRQQDYKLWTEAADQLCPNDGNPCLNNGRCTMKEQTPFCDCSSTKHSGETCNEMYEDSVATFNGSEWLSYDLRNRPMSSFDDEITVTFQTTEPNGLLLHTGQSEDYISLVLHEGMILLIISLGAGTYEMVVQPQRDLFNDGKWHSIKVNRTLRNMDIIIDRASVYNRYLNDDYSQLTLNDVIYVGGSPPTKRLPGLRFISNFRGCLKEVLYSNSNHKQLPISKLARNGDPDVVIHGNIVFGCSDQPLSPPVTFTTSKSFLKIAAWESSRKGELEMRLKTTEQDGVLIYAKSQANDLFAIELYSGNIFIVVNLGTGTSRFRVRSFVSDGNWHRLSVTRVGRNITISLNENSRKFLIFGSDDLLDIPSEFYVGGADFGSQFQLILGLQTAPFRKGFIGCVKDLRVDDVIVDLQTLAEAENQFSGSIHNGVKPDCLSTERSLCLSSPCKNGGICKDGFGRFHCDCSNTSFTGDSCEHAVSRFVFNGSEFMNFPLNTPIFTDGEEISLRFKTLIPRGLLFATTSNSSNDMILIQLIQGGGIQFLVNIGDQSRKLIFDKRLNDNRWHIVALSRRGRTVTFKLDGVIQRATLNGEINELQFDTIHLGMITKNNVLSAQPHAETSFLQPYYAFIGLLENAAFNSFLLLDSCLNETLPCSYNSSISDGSKIIAYAASFYSPGSYVSLRPPENYSLFRIFLSLKTTARNGLIFYEGNTSKNFIALEMVEGKILCTFRFEKTEQVLSIGNQILVNDNEWHNINLTQDERSAILTIDQLPPAKSEINGTKAFDFSGVFYLGGVPRSVFDGVEYRSAVASPKGFQGCLGNLIVNDELMDVAGKDRISSSGTIWDYCKAPSNVCTEDSCLNGGVCFSEWNEYVCDCSLTKFVGKQCQTHWSSVSKEGTAFLFGRKSGLILYKWENVYPSPRTDKFSIGFSTFQTNTVLFKVLGMKINGVQNYLELFIKNGQLTLKFNIGSDDVILSDKRSVSDGQYHFCVLRRDWMNATMRVDDRPEIRVGQAERKSTVFSSQSFIIVAGNINETFLTPNSVQDVSPEEMLRNLIKPFHGKLVGFFFNDVKVLDWAAEGDFRVKTIGDVQLLRGPIASHPAASPTTSSPAATAAAFTTFTTTKSSDKVATNRSNCEEDKVCSKSPGPETFTGSASIKNVPDEKTNLSSIATRGLISGGASLGVVLIMFLFYRYRYRTLCCIKRRRNQRILYANGKHVLVGANGTIVKHNNYSSSHRTSKEIYV